MAQLAALPLPLLISSRSHPFTPSLSQVGCRPYFAGLSRGYKLSPQSLRDRGADHHCVYGLHPRDITPQSVFAYVLRTAYMAGVSVNTIYHFCPLCATHLQTCYTKSTQANTRSQTVNVGIVGNGVVGSALAHCYKDVAQVLIYDQVTDRSPDDLDEVLACDLVFICLPESSVDRFFQSTSKVGNNRLANYVIKSTVPVGDTKRLQVLYGLPNLVHSPEFLTERTAQHDANRPKVNIIGVPDGYTPGNVSGKPLNRAFLALDDLYRARWSGIVPTLYMSSEESETVKLASNAWAAVKISFFNELYSLVSKLDMHWDVVLNGMLSLGRINWGHTQVPGPDGKFGYGGRCLPGHYCVTLDTGEQVSLRDLARLVNSRLDGVRVRSTGSTCLTSDYKVVLDVYERHYEGEMIVLRTEGGQEIQCTPDHLVPVMRDARLLLVRAVEIEPTDSLMVDDGK